MKLDEILDDRQPEPEAAIPARGRRIGLAESIEHAGQEFRLDAEAGVLHDDLHVRVHALQDYLDAPARRRELDGIRQQVPQPCAP
jgi:hypothetical protein